MDRPHRPVNACAAFGLLALALLPGCGFLEPPPVQRGVVISEDQLRQISPGVQSRADVQTLLGSPSARATFDDSAWYYISSRTVLRPVREQSVTDQRVVAVEFDSAGKVTQVRELTEADARPVRVVGRETPVPGNDRTLLQALFGNIGRFTPGGGVGGQQTGSQSVGPGVSGAGAR